MKRKRLYRGTPLPSDVERVKMNLVFKEITPSFYDIKTFEEINREAFPDSEYMSPEEMFEFAKNTGAEILGIYDGDAFVGFTLFLKNDKCGYIFFLAIGKSYRSKGYGSESLKALIKRYPALQIILDFEEITESAENLEQRVRRKAFYLKNGFCETGHFTLLRGDRFEVVCNNGALLTEDFKRLISVIHDNCPYFPNVLL